jgi:signal peptidase I
MYGENVEGKFYIGPVLLSCLIERNDQLFPTSDLGPDLVYGIDVAFLKDDLLNKNYDFNIDTEFYGANLVPQVGDIIMFQEGYFEVDNVVNNQLFVGKDPEYPNSINPLNPGLQNFGWDISILCKTHYVPQDRVNITKARL